MKRLLIVGAGLLTPVAHAGECSAPPVRNSQQAVCYATAYAEKNRLEHGRSFNTKVTKGKKDWTVRFVDGRPDARGAAWEVDIDSASATATRFAANKKRER